MLGYFPDGVARCGPAVANISWFLSLGRSAVEALLHIGTSEMLRVFGQVVLARFLRDAISFGKGVNVRCQASVATSSCLAVDNDLWRKGNIGPCAVTCNIDPVCNGGSTALRPAATTIDRDVLVLGPREVVDP